MTKRTRVNVDANTPRPCPSWCEQNHDGTAALHRRVVHQWNTAPGQTSRIVVVRYDKPDGTSAPAAVQLHGGRPVKFTPAEARKVAALFGWCATQRDGLTETATIGRAYAAAADLIDQE